MVVGHATHDGGEAREVRRSPLAMAVLLVLAAEPLHPYGLRQRILDWDKDRVINVGKRNIIYQMVRRLERDGLIVVHETVRQDSRPERTVYRAAPEGVELARRWVYEVLCTPKAEYPEFPAALAFVEAIPRADARAALRERLAASERALATFEADIARRLAEHGGPVDPIHLVDTDYQRAMAAAEIGWLRSTIDSLGTS